MPREKGRKGTNGGRNLETLVKLAAPAIGTAAGAFIVAGLTCIAFAHLYGY